MSKEQKAPAGHPAMKAGTRLRPRGFVVLTEKRRGLPAREAHVPHGWDYTVVEEGDGVPAWDLTRKQIRADVAARFADRFDTVKPAARPSGDAAASPSEA
jgi:hypothetical protein